MARYLANTSAKLNQHVNCSVRLMFVRCGVGSDFSALMLSVWGESQIRCAPVLTVGKAAAPVLGAALVRPALQNERSGRDRKLDFHTCNCKASSASVM